MNLMPTAISSFSPTKPAKDWCCKNVSRHAGSDSVRISFQCKLSYAQIKCKCLNHQQLGSASAPASKNLRCAASGQTQTLTREAPSVTRSPTREWTGAPPQLDDGGPGVPPYFYGGSGGGGGGTGGSSSGGFLLFGFLAVLSFLKDKESELLAHRRR